MSFTILQQRTTAIRAVALCPTMDLLVIINTRGALTLYRVLTWEKVLGKSAADITESGSSIPVSVAFCASGRALGIGCSEGQVLVLDLERQESLLSQCRSSLNSDKSIIRVAWVSHDASSMRSRGGESSACQSNIRLRVWKDCGGVNLAERIGMLEANEPPSGVFGESSESSIIQAIINSTQSSVLLSLDSQNHLNGYMFGIYHIISVNCQSVTQGLTVVEGSAAITGFFLSRGSEGGSGGGSSAGSSGGTSSSSSMRPTTSDRLCHGIEMLSVPYLNCPHCRFKGLEHMVTIHLSVQADLTKLQDMVSNHGRKWKEATRVILPKLSLLQGVLDGYQLSMNPVQFMYVISQCGLWHPAVQASFSQHWNEQGISRLRSAVDSTSNAIVRTLQLKAIPTATNVCLRCRYAGCLCAEQWFVQPTLSHSYPLSHPFPHTPTLTSFSFLFLISPRVTPSHPLPHPSCTPLSHPSPWVVLLQRAPSCRTCPRRVPIQRLYQWQ